MTEPHPFLEACKPYLRDDGIMTLGERNADGSLSITDNPYLHTSVYIYMLRRLRVDQLEIQKAKGAFDAYLDRRIRATGRWWPRPEKDWGTNVSCSHDEACGIAAIGSQNAQYLYDHARPLWVFSSTSKIKDQVRGWHYRLGYLVPFIRALAGHDVPWLEQIWYARDIEKATRDSYREPDIRTSTRILFILQSQWLHKFPPRMHQAMTRFMYLTQEQFGGLGGVFAVAYKNHPFGTFSQGLSIRPSTETVLT